MIDQTTIQTKSLMDLLKAMNEAIITNITITNRHLPKRPILRPLPETETVIDFLLKTSQWMIINWNTTMITNQMSWICFLIFQIRKSLKKDHLVEVSKKLANILFEIYILFSIFTNLKQKCILGSYSGSGAETSGAYEEDFPELTTAKFSQLRLDSDDVSPINHVPSVSSNKDFCF